MRETVPSASRVTIDPTTLQMPMVFEPFDFASRKAAIVSAVSPDCVISMVSASELTSGSR